MVGRYRYLAVATVVLVAGQTGCDVGAGPRGPGDHSPASGTGIGGSAPPDAVPPELQGTWSLHVYCASAGSSREEGGFGTVVERTPRSGGRHPGPTTMTLALHPERFEVSWLQRDGTWEVGWSGPVALRGDTLRLDERSFQRFRDVFTWSLDGHRLSLRYPATRSGEVHGHAGDVSSVAHISLPRTVVDCPPNRVRAVGR